MSPKNCPAVSLSVPFAGFPGRLYDPRSVPKVESDSPASAPASLKGRLTSKLLALSNLGLPILSALKSLTLSIRPSAGTDTPAWTKIVPWSMATPSGPISSVASKGVWLPTVIVPTSCGFST